MKTANIMKAVCVAGLAATCVWSLAACAGGASASGAKTYTGGVAATVNGTEIPEDPNEHDRYRHLGPVAC